MGLKQNSQICQDDQSKVMKNLLYNMGKSSFTCYMYKRELLNGFDLRFDTETKFGEDREFNWKYLSHCNTAAYVDAPLYWYRVNQESATKGTVSWRKTDLLKAVKRIESYLKELNCPFSEEFNSYMYARSMWAVAKAFAIDHRKDLFKKLLSDYDVRTCMKRTLRDSNKLVSLASAFFLINPNLFYYVIGFKNK